MTKNKYSIKNLGIEVTRRCNMRCKHCLRGASQSKDIQPEVLKAVAEQVNSIHMLAFTGGEPSLNAKGIRTFMRDVQINGVAIENFYIATNGKAYSDEFFRVIVDMYCYCVDNSYTSVEISRSPWHLDQDEHAIARLKTLTFVRDRYRLEKEKLIIMGNAADNYLGYKTVPIEKTKITNNLIEGFIYITVDGDILTSCDYSYDLMEQVKIGNVLTDNILELLNEINKKTF